MKFVPLALLFILLHSNANAADGPLSGIETAGQDRAVRPQDNLYRAANGHWLDTTPIPAGKSHVIGIEINDLTDARLRALVEGNKAVPVSSSPAAYKLSIFHASYIDTTAIDRAGLAPMRTLLADLDKVATLDDLMRWQGRVQGVIETPVWLRVFPT